jgi:peptidoglycan/LPS O-acetylase OafA/YrhL
MRPGGTIRRARRRARRRAETGAGGVTRDGGGSAQRLDALTGLRFLAAAVVVADHLCYLFGTPPPDWMGRKAVSLFFVLSGFILTHVYPALDDAVARRRFWRARFARVWPLHIATFMPYTLLLPWAADTVLANIFLVQDWIPFNRFFHYYNAPSWSISAEAFLYLCFPALIGDFARSWPWKLVLAALALAAMITLSDALNLPVLMVRQGTNLTREWFVYFSPLARVFEFVLGMATALAWRRLHYRAIRLGPAAGTAIEIVAIVVFAANMYAAGTIGVWAATITGSISLMFWLSMGGASCLGSALLIAVLAYGRSKISTALASPLMVFLGEISLGVYLVHGGILNLVEIYAGTWPPMLISAFAVVAVPAYAILLHFCLERPARAFLRSPRGHQPSTLAWPGKP